MPQIIRILGVIFDVFLKKASNHAVDGTNLGVWIDYPRCPSPARERKQLTSEGSGALRGMQHLPDILIGGAFLFYLFRCEFSETENRCEYVIEVVSDPSRKSTDHFHFLSPVKLLLEFFPFGHILDMQSDVIIDERKSTSVQMNFSTFCSFERRYSQV